MNLFTSMNVFIHIVEKGSLSAAAQTLNMSPTVVGNHLKALEDRLEMVLVKRTTRRQMLTDHGQVYYRRCLEILNLVEKSDCEMSDGKITPKGRLRISAPISFGHSGLVSVITEYMSQYPWVHIDLELSDRNVDLIGDDFDAAIRIGELDDSSYIARKLKPYGMMVCASPDYLSQNGTPSHPNDLLDHECLIYGYHPTAKWSFEQNGKVIKVNVKGKLHMNSSDGLVRAALQNAGIAMQAEALIAPYVETGQLVRLFTDYQLVKKPMHIIFAKEQFMLPKLRSFIDFCANDPRLKIN